MTKKSKTTSKPTRRLLKTTRRSSGCCGGKPAVSYALVTLIGKDVTETTPFFKTPHKLAKAHSLWNNQIEPGEADIVSQLKFNGVIKKGTKVIA